MNMNDKNEQSLFKRELYRLVEEIERCEIHTVKCEIGKDILLLKKVLDG